MFDADAAPMVERFARCGDRVFCLRNSGFRHCADDLFWRTGIDGVDQFAGPYFLAVNHERIFLPQPATHFAEGGPHLFLTESVDEVYQGRVLVGVFWRFVRGRAIAAWRARYGRDSRSRPHTGF